MCTGPDENASASSAKDAKEAALRRLAATDAPKATPKTSVEKGRDRNALPEWIYFALPIAGAVVAFAVQYFTKAPLPVG